MATYEQALRALAAADAAGNTEDARQLAMLAQSLKPKQEAGPKNDALLSPRGLATAATNVAAGLVGLPEALGAGANWVNNQIGRGIHAATNKGREALGIQAQPYKDAPNPLGFLPTAAGTKRALTMRGVNDFEPQGMPAKIAMAGLEAAIPIGNPRRKGQLALSALNAVGGATGQLLSEMVPDSMGTPANVIANIAGNVLGSAGASAAVRGVKGVGGLFDTGVQANKNAEDIIRGKTKNINDATFAGAAELQRKSGQYGAPLLAHEALDSVGLKGVAGAANVAAGGERLGEVLRGRAPKIDKLIDAHLKAVSPAEADVASSGQFVRDAATKQFNKRFKARTNAYNETIKPVLDRTVDPKTLEATVAKIDELKAGFLPDSQERQALNKVRSQLVVPKDAPNVYEAKNYSDVASKLADGFSDSDLTLWRRGVGTPKDLPLKLSQWVKSKGGLKERDYNPAALMKDSRVLGRRGDVQNAFDGKAPPGLINNSTGKTLDELAQAAVEEGYLPPSNGWGSSNLDSSMLRDMLVEESAGVTDYYPQYHADKMAALDAYNGRLDYLDELDRRLSDLGIIDKKLTNEQIRNIIASEKDMLGAQPSQSRPGIVTGEGGAKYRGEFQPISNLQKTILDNAVSTLDSNNTQQNVKRVLTEVRNPLNKGLRSQFKEYEQADDAYKAVTEKEFTPRENNPLIGQFIDYDPINKKTPDFAPFIAAIKDTKSTSPKQVYAAAKDYLSADVNQARQAFRAVFQDAWETAQKGKKGEAGVPLDAGKKYSLALHGDPAVRRNINAIYKAIDSTKGFKGGTALKIAGKLEDFSNDVMEILDRTDLTPGMESPTATRTQFNEMAGESVAADLMTLNPAEALKSLGLDKRMVRQKVREKTVERIVDILTAENSVELVREIAKGGMTPAQKIRLITGFDKNLSEKLASSAMAGNRERMRQQQGGAR